MEGYYVKSVEFFDVRNRICFMKFIVVLNLGYVNETAAHIVIVNAGKNNSSNKKINASTFLLNILCTFSNHFTDYALLQF